MKKLSLILLFSLWSASSWAIGDAALPLQQQWEQIKYKMSASQRESAFEKLQLKAQQQATQHPNDAEVLVWQAIILSSYAGERGGLGALGLVKQAKAILEQVEASNPQVLNGSVYTTLGSLYYKVPGWPIGFGDHKKAEVYLKKAMALAPDSIDAHYFYADFLVEQGEYAQALPLLEKALTLPARPDRPLADQGRRAEIKQLLAKVKNKL